MTTPALVENGAITESANESALQDVQPEILAAEEVAVEPVESTAPATEVAAEPEVQAPDALARAQEENTQLKREAQQHQKAAADSRIQNAAGQYAESRIAHYQSQGIDEQTSRQLGVLEAREQVNAYRAEQAELRVNQMEISQQYGVPQEQLSGFNDEASMRHYAEQYANTTGPQAKQMVAMQKQIDQLTKAQVPAQSFNQPGGTGGVPVTSDNIDMLFVDFQDEHPGQTNPYEKRYRDFLKRR